MPRKRGEEPELSGTGAPGMTVSVGKAARILDVSRDTLKLRAAEWGLTTFWDRRGRRYLISELEATRKGMLEPKPKDTVTLDFYSLEERFPLLDVYRFRIYRTGQNRGYIGLFVSRRYADVVKWLRENHGDGTYILKLLDEGEKMTRFNFALCITDVDEETQEMIDDLESIKSFTKIFREKTRQLE
jgi:hypothetical protein